jgi:hypothetical protein
MMVDSVNDLAGLSRQLNQSSDKINSIIADLNAKLAALNLGVEAFCRRPFESGDFEKLESTQAGTFPRQASVSYLGFCKLDDKWQMAVKYATLVERYDADVGELCPEAMDPEYAPLTSATRETRTAALSFVPQLLDEIKMKAESVLRSIEKAEQTAAKL